MAFGSENLAGSGATSACEIAGEGGYNMEDGTRQLLYLSSKDVANTKLGMQDVIRIVEEMLRHKARELVEMPPKLGIHPAAGSFIHAMPASVSGMSAAGIKWVSVYPSNRDVGLPQVSGQIVLNDSQCGLTVAILDCSWITAARTAAASTLSARYLARENSEIIGILGCGIQARAHLEAFLCEFSVRKVIAYDIVEDTLKGFVCDMSKSHGIEIAAVAHPREAVEPCDIVLTAGPITNPPHATIKADWLKQGACGISVDYGSYWDSNALAQMDRLCTDDVNQYEQHISSGFLKGMPAIELELASLVAGTEAGRRSPVERTFACNLGIALEDVVVAKAVVERAKKLGVGAWLSR